MSSSYEVSIPEADNAAQGDRISKRPKLRKGTFSCWECKRRKTRCEFRPKASSVCLSCQRRDLPCISQEFPEPGDNRFEEVEKRIVHVEGLVSQLTRQRSSRLSRDRLSQQLTGSERSVHEVTSGGILTTGTLGDPFQLSSGVNNRLPLYSSPSAPQDALSICRSLSGYLHSILSHENRISVVLGHRKLFSLSFQVPKETLQQRNSCTTDTQELVQLSQLPPLTSHPVFFARKFIQLAICLHQLDSITSAQLGVQFNESTCDSARRYIEIASSYVTSKDSLVNSIEGVETLILEARYYIAAGELRLAWLVFRRALGIAQLMRLPQLAQSKSGRAKFMWFRLIYSERFLSLMLGLPLTTDDDVWSRKQLLAAHPPFEKLERTHVHIAGRIISRNLRMQSHWGSPKDGSNEEYKETQDIDHELKHATRIMPVSWWVTPALNPGVTDAEVMEVTTKLLAQMHQYYLLVLTHQPYLLRSLLGISMMEESESTRHYIDYTYSRLAILSASREILSRFMLARHFLRETAFRGLDDKAYTASMALLLTHLDGHRLGQANVFEHQRSQDLGVIQNVIHFMDKLSPAADFQIKGCSIQVLKRLVDIEADAADGVSYIARGGQDAILQDDHTDNDDFQLSFPYFGTISLVRKEQFSSSDFSREADSVHMADTSRRPTNAYSIGFNRNMDANVLATAPGADTEAFISRFHTEQSSLAYVTDNLDNARASSSFPASDFQNLPDSATYTSLGISPLEHQVDDNYFQLHETG
ncbi:transcriptional regulator family: Fungal Specific TF [Paecilomyces variotii]|nr:transcriptional regulator family: Fungal Specific TF [Paecilomyces variotii]KAJ9336364.1 transcriptional regulator family: Fungal Specific TF [Paecilomyces variotii]